MRNLKRLLSAALALAMSMSIATVASAATTTDFSDAADISYTEAVEVMSTLGVLEGFDTGDFQPEGTLTREQAAKIITYMLLGEENAEKLGSDVSSFTDVEANRWSAGYINYCATNGIIAGNGDGTFAPEAPLTGYAFAKMLLGALGYRADIEGFTGPQWTLKVASVASKAGLLNDIEGFSGNAEITREEASQMALNCLKATLVEYTGNTIDVTTGDSTVTIGNNKYEYVTSNNTKINDNIKGDDDSNVSEYLTLEFGEQYFQNLVLQGTVDDFNRPSNEWIYNKESVGVYPIRADFEYTTQVARTDATADAKLRALGLKNYKLAAGAEVAVNGVVTSLTSVAAIADYTDNGTLVQVYTQEDAPNTIYSVAVVKTQLMQVKNVAKDYVSLEDVDSHDNVTNANAAFNQGFLDVSVANVKEGDAGYDVLSALKEGDLVAVVPVRNGSTYTVTEAYVPTTVTGKLTSIGTYNGNQINVTVGGEKYNLALWNDNFSGLTADAIKATTKDVTLLFDKYGNAMQIKDAGATTSYMVVGGTYTNVVDGKIVNIVKGWDLNGTAVSLNLGTSTTANGYANAVPGNLVKYTNSGATNNGEYRLVVSNGAGDASAAHIFELDATSAIKASDSKIDIAGTIDGYVWVAKNIKFVYTTMNEDGEIESIEIKNGVQTATTSELGQYYDLNNNNSKDGFERSAQAYLNKDENAVQAVVIKQESNDAISSDLMYIKALLGEEGVDPDTGKKIYGYTAAKMTEEGLEENETIYSYENIPANTFAKYVEVENEKYADNFYKLSQYNQQGRTTTTIQTTITDVIDIVNGIVELGTLKDMNGANIPDANTNLDDQNGGGDTINTARVLDAEWLDLSNTGLDVNDIEDLEELFNKSDRIDVSLVINDNKDSLGFRNVAMIVINSVSGYDPDSDTTDPADPAGAVKMTSLATIGDIQNAFKAGKDVVINGDWSHKNSDGKTTLMIPEGRTLKVNGDFTCGTNVNVVDNAGTLIVTGKLTTDGHAGIINGTINAGELVIDNSTAVTVQGDITVKNDVTVADAGKITVNKSASIISTKGDINFGAADVENNGTVEAPKGTVTGDVWDELANTLKAEALVVTTLNVGNNAKAGTVEVGSITGDVNIENGTLDVTGDVTGKVTVKSSATHATVAIDGTVKGDLDAQVAGVDVTVGAVNGAITGAGKDDVVNENNDPNAVTKLSGNVASGAYTNVELAADAVIAGNVVVTGTVTVASGADVDIMEGATLTVQGELKNVGTVTASEPTGRAATVTVATLELDGAKVIGTADLSDVTTAFAGSVNVGNAASLTFKEYTAENATLVVENGGTIVDKSGRACDAGLTEIIETGATVKLGTTAYISDAGKVKLTDGEIFVSKNSVVLRGDAELAESIKVQAEDTFVVAAGSTLKFASNKDITGNNGATLVFDAEATVDGYNTSTHEFYYKGGTDEVATGADLAGKTFTWGDSASKWVANVEAPAAAG